MLQAEASNAFSQLYVKSVTVVDDAALDVVAHKRGELVRFAIAKAAGRTIYPGLLVLSRESVDLPRCRLRRECESGSI